MDEKHAAIPLALASKLPTGRDTCGDWGLPRPLLSQATSGHHLAATGGRFALCIFPPQLSCNTVTVLQEDKPLPSCSLHLTSTARMFQPKSENRCHRLLCITSQSFLEKTSSASFSLGELNTNRGNTVHLRLLF